MSDETTASEPAADPTAIMEMTAELVSSYVTKNHVRAAELPDLISTIHASLAGMGSAPEAASEPAKLVPPVSIKRSITDDYLVSMEDGKQYKALKRHLTKLGMTPADYREKWGLPHDYPMVAPAYSRHRSAMAKQIGLGAQGRKR